MSKDKCAVLSAFEEELRALINGIRLDINQSPQLVEPYCRSEPRDYQKAIHAATQLLEWWLHTFEGSLPDVAKASGKRQEGNKLDQWIDSRFLHII